MSDEILRLFVLRNRRYIEQSEFWMPEVELGLTFWEGRHQGTEGVWLRWCDENGMLIQPQQNKQNRNVGEQNRSDNALKN